MLRPLCRVAAATAPRLRTAVSASSAPGALLAPQRRWNDMDALQDKRNAKAMAKRDLMRQAKDNMQIVEDNVQQKIVANRDIPKKYTAIVVTHIGSMDGVDEEEPEPRLLTRKEAFALAERDNFDVCFIKEGDNPHTAECRLRYLKLWLRAQVRTQTLAGRKTIEEKLRDQDRRVPISEEVILLRSVTDSQSIATKANEAVLCIKRGKNARIHLKLFASEEHAGDFLVDFLSRVTERAKEHGVAFAVVERNIHKKGGGCLLLKQ